MVPGTTPGRNGAPRPSAETREALLQGQALFLAGDFYEAHEVWEDAWRFESGEVRLLLQGLVQMAGGFVKAIRDARPGGAVKLFEAALEKLDRLPDELAGVPVKEVRVELELAAGAARRWRDGHATRLEALPPRLDFRLPE